VCCEKLIVQVKWPLSYVFKKGGIFNVLESLPLECATLSFSLFLVPKNLFYGVHLLKHAIKASGFGAKSFQVGDFDM